MYRSRKVELAYRKNLQQRDPNKTGCDFCDPAAHGVKTVADYMHCYVMANTYPYSQWEFRKVVEHLMVVPRRHVSNLVELTAEESEELMVVFGKYEQDGYDIFARTPTSTVRTLVHQHTHLIKAEDKRARGIFYWSKPYILKLFR